MGLRGRRWMIKDFSDKSIGKKMHTIYKKILKKKIKEFKNVNYTWD